MRLCTDLNSRHDFFPLSMLRFPTDQSYVVFAYRPSICIRRCQSAGRLWTIATRPSLETAFKCIHETRKNARRISFSRLFNDNVPVCLCLPRSRRLSVLSYEIKKRCREAFFWFDWYRVVRNVCDWSLAIMSSAAQSHLKTSQLVANHVPIVVKNIC